MEMRTIWNSSLVQETVVESAALLFLNTISVHSGFVSRDAM
jgi:hypothetical protein